MVGQGRCVHGGDEDEIVGKGVEFLERHIVRGRDTEGAEFVANNCRRSIEKLQIPHEFSEVAEVVTISVGFCTVSPEKGTDSSLLINAANKALYTAKEGGRNRVEKIVLH